MKIKIERLYDGIASVRDYLCEQAIESGEDLEFEITGDNKQKGEVMIIATGEIALKATHRGKKVFKSLYDDDQIYGLWDFNWNPILPQKSLFTVENSRI